MPISTWLSLARVGKVRAGAHAPQQRRIVKQVVPRYGPAAAPPALEIRSESFRSDLLAVAVDAAERLVKMLARLLAVIVKGLWVGFLAAVGHGHLHGPERSELAVGNQYEARKRGDDRPPQCRW